MSKKRNPRPAPRRNPGEPKSDQSESESVSTDLPDTADSVRITSDDVSGPVSETTDPTRSLLPGSNGQAKTTVRAQPTDQETVWVTLKVPISRHTQQDTEHGPVRHIDIGNLRKYPNGYRHGMAVKSLKNGFDQERVKLKYNGERASGSYPEVLRALFELIADAYDESFK